jgi:hypothetical protein
MMRSDNHWVSWSVANDAHIEPELSLANHPGMRRMGSLADRFPWIGWRGVFARDPEGNSVEFVSDDASVSPDEWKAGTVN